MNRAMMAIVLVAVLGAFAAPLLGAAPAAPGPQDACAPGAGAHGQPLRNFLKPDGTLNLPPEGIKGSIDPVGFRLASRPGEAPRFASEGREMGRAEAVGDECWDTRFTVAGMPFRVDALAWDGTNLYAGGVFSVVGATNANNIARWNGTSWNELGAGTNGEVEALLWNGTTLYAAGFFTMAGGVSTNGVAKWNGSSWSALGGGISGGYQFVTALAWDGANLYAGGEFSSPGNNIAKWNVATSSWSALGAGTNERVFALAWCGTNLYAGGLFTAAGNSPAQYIARWNGTSWSALGSGMNDGVEALAWDGTNLYAGGWFTAAGGVPNTSYVARWNGTSWSALGLGADNYVAALAWDGTNIYMGGGFTMAGGISARAVAKWNGSTWSPLGSGINGGVYALTSNGANLFAGGGFTAAGTVMASAIARWDGTAWNAMSAPGEGMGGEIDALAWDGANLYAGGYFTAAGTVETNYIAKWDGANWSPLGVGMNAPGYALDVPVFALAWDGIGNTLYAAGSFTTAGGGAANHIAKWDGTSWSALGSGVDSQVLALAWDGTYLYAGGWFTTAGGGSANYIAKWNGTAWSPLGTGMNSAVYALAWNGTNLYAGGNFTTAGGVTVGHIAKWDGTAWSALGEGTSERVFALSWDGAHLYAGGLFTAAGTVSARYIARWDGENWSPLGSGVDNYVTALAWDGADLCVGGEFTSAQSGPTAITANHIAKWDGTNWSPLGSGTNYGVTSLAPCGIDLYAGGYFETAGSGASVNIARWMGGPTLSYQPEDGEMCEGQSAIFSVAATGPGLTYQWQSDAGSGFVDLNDAPPYSGTSTPTLTISPAALDISGYHYRCNVLTTCGSLASRAATLTVHSRNQQVSISSHPANTTTCDGLLAGFSVTTSGYGLVYRWQMKNYGDFYDLTDMAPYSGTSTASLTISPAIAYMSGYQYRCVVSTTCGTSTATSNAATLTVLSALATPNMFTVTDPDSCSVGLSVSYMAVSGATAYDLLVDGATVLSNAANPATYIPGDSLSHTFQVRARNATCTTGWSTGMMNMDVNNGASKAAGPNPPDGQTGLSTYTTLTWNPSLNAAYYDVYFGTGPNPVWMGRVTDILYYPGLLNMGTAYTWKIVPGNNTCGSASSVDLWSFRTVSPPRPGTVSDQVSGNGGGGRLNKASGTDIQFTWDSPNGPCAPTDYKIYKGLLGHYYSHAIDTCTTMGATNWIEAGGLVDPNSYYYLIVPATSSAEGSYGQASSGAEIPQAAAACLPQDLTSCAK